MQPYPYQSEKSFLTVECQIAANCPISCFEQKKDSSSDGVSSFSTIFKDLQFISIVAHGVDK